MEAQDERSIMVRIMELEQRVFGIEEREIAREKAAQAMQADLRETLKTLGPLGVMKKLLFSGKANGEAQQIG